MMAYRIGQLGLLVALLLLMGVTVTLGQGEATPAVEPEATVELLRNPALLQDEAVLTGEPCAVPCWRGITPGETSWDEAVAILQADPMLENVQVQEDANSDAKAASWAQLDGDECCQMFSVDGQTVWVLFLRLAPEIALGDVVEVQGEPAFAVGSPFTDDQAIINLIYPDQRMVVYSFVPGETGSLSAESEVIGILLMSSQDLDLLLGTSNLFEWRGYADYATYNPDISTFDVTPSVTLTPAGG
jgi:hypothetical protein